MLLRSAWIDLKCRQYFPFSDRPRRMRRDGLWWMWNLFGCWRDTFPWKNWRSCIKSTRTRADPCATLHCSRKPDCQFNLFQQVPRDLPFAAVCDGLTRKIILQNVGCHEIVPVSSYKPIMASEFLENALQTVANRATSPVTETVRVSWRFHDSCSLELMQH